ncbi:MAG: cation:proton antiporter [Candidatus Blackburnbacteria bacterium]|nr:cation:proton antiporter [Candidatus Blackburnbacteria bacterium]
MSPLLVVAIGIGLAAALGYVARIFRQPPLVGYIFAGLLLSLFGIVIDGGSESLYENMSTLGITFLLFLVGLELNLNELKTLGRVIAIGGLGQIVLTFTFAFLLGRSLGFSLLEALYIGLALTFCSTIIIIKLLSEKKDLASLYGKISVGVLLVQDLVAIIVLVLLSGFRGGNPGLETVILVLAKGILLLGGIWIAAKFILTRVFDKIAQESSELLFVSSIAWVLLVAAGVSLPAVGFSPQMGGFLAGIALANSTGHLQIASRVKPLRDFFVTIFFLLLGTKLIVGISPGLILPAIVLSAFVIIANILVVLTLMSLLGHKKRTSFLVAVSFTQISEFSLILVTLGQNLGHISSSIVSLVTLVAVITMAVSTYLILNGAWLYQRLSFLLKVFELKKVRENAFTPTEKFAGHVVLLGCDRTGRALLFALKKLDCPFVIVDFNPAVVTGLVADGHNAYYADAADTETLLSLGINEAKMIISTTGSLEDNLSVLELLKSSKHQKKPISIFTAANPPDALRLYKDGATYVVIPQTVGGEYLSGMIDSCGLEPDHYNKLRNRNIEQFAY